MEIAMLEGTRNNYTYNIEGDKSLMETLICLDQPQKSKFDNKTFKRQYNVQVQA